ncbi:hypothetical protein DID76_02620 [Candidatus Marinamargulisbacteria bacterium SCGC AG-414-C22]|nr:hypothetical protein DID76_02620 [Candidatus Marinamargulisbacteria bacterium SCGC AG-414-C22]
MKKETFLLECGCDVIPRYLIEPYCNFIEVLFYRFCKQHYLEFSSVRVVASDQRIIIRVFKLVSQQVMSTEQVQGPLASDAYDEDQLLTQAGIDFAATHQVKEDDLFVATIEDVDYVCCHRFETGRDVCDIFVEFLPDFIVGLPVATDTDWSQVSDFFSESLYWMCCLYGDRTLSFFVGDIEANNQTVVLEEFDVIPDTSFKPVKTAGSLLAMLKSHDIWVRTRSMASFVPYLKELTVEDRVFKIERQCGRGKYATIFKAECDGKFYALKVFPYNEINDEKRFKLISREYHIGCFLTELNSDYFIKTIPFHIGKGKIHIYGTVIEYYVTVQEFVESVDLDFPLDQPWDLVKDLIRAVALLHKAGIVHRDIKPANFMITPDDNFKLLDFGFAANIKTHQDFLLKRHGTPKYMPPHVSDDILYEDQAIFADMWSVGAAILKVVTGQTGCRSMSVRDDRVQSSREQIVYFQSQQTLFPEDLYEFIKQFCFFMNDNNDFDESLISERVNSWLTQDHLYSY